MGQHVLFRFKGALRRRERFAVQDFPMTNESAAANIPEAPRPYK
jgi:hypothetical protein